MKKYNVLKGSNFAALPLDSTFEPIRIINEVIQDAIEKDRELWILAQDLGKAYDRVNLFMLDKALQRIKTPQKFRKLISYSLKKKEKNIFIQIQKIQNVKRTNIFKPQLVMLIKK